MSEHEQIDRTSPEPGTVPARVLGLLFPGRRSLEDYQRNSSIQFHVLELILNRIPKGTCRLRI